MMNNDRIAITCGYDMCLKVTSLENQFTIFEERGDCKMVALCLSDDHKYLITADKDNEMHIYFTQTWIQLCKIQQDYDFIIANI